MWKFSLICFKTLELYYPFNFAFWNTQFSLSSLWSAESFADAVFGSFRALAVDWTIHAAGTVEILCASWALQCQGGADDGENERDDEEDFHLN